MIKSIILLTLITSFFINCGIETKANSVNTTEKKLEGIVITTDSTPNEVTESTTLEKPEVVQENTEKKAVLSKESNIIKNDNKKAITNKNEELSYSSQNIIEVKEVIAPEFNHQAFDELLRKYVNYTGKVNYKGFKTEIGKLNAYINELSTQYANLDTWSRDKKLAYWINVYNAHTIKLIVDNYPVSSINKLKDGKPWDYKFIKLGDKTYTLNEVENDIIRPNFNEPRIHFALNCAAKSCPKLMNKAWKEDNLNSSLNMQTKAFLTNTNENNLGVNEVKISKIFDWYKDDFTKSGSLISFIKKYSSATINDDAKVSYNEYNWDLNE